MEEGTTMIMFGKIVNQTAVTIRKMRGFLVEGNAGRIYDGKIITKDFK